MKASKFWIVASYRNSQNLPCKPNRISLHDLGSERNRILLRQKSDAYRRWSAKRRYHIGRSDRSFFPIEQIFSYCSKYLNREIKVLSSKHSKRGNTHMSIKHFACSLKASTASVRQAWYRDSLGITRGITQTIVTKATRINIVSSTGRASASGPGAIHTFMVICHQFFETFQPFSSTSPAPILDSLTFFSFTLLTPVSTLRFSQYLSLLS